MKGSNYMNNEATYVDLVSEMRLHLYNGQIVEMYVPVVNDDDDLRKIIDSETLATAYIIHVGDGSRTICLPRPALIYAETDTPKSDPTPDLPNDDSLFN